MYIGAGAAGLEGVRGTIAFSRFFLLTVMWSASSSRRSEVTPGHAAYMDALSHVINGLSGASHFLAFALAVSRAYAAAVDKYGAVKSGCASVSGAMHARERLIVDAPGDASGMIVSWGWSLATSWYATVSVGIGSSSLSHHSSSTAMVGGAFPATTSLENAMTRPSRAVLLE